MSDTVKQMTKSEWMAEGFKRFGSDKMKWRFKCPSCGFVATPADWKAVGADPGEVAFSCVGRHLDNATEAFQRNGGPCNYAGGGLFRINPVHVDNSELFDFADPDDLYTPIRFESVPVAIPGIGKPPKKTMRKGTRK